MHCREVKNWGSTNVQDVILYGMLHERGQVFLDIQYVLAAKNELTLLYLNGIIMEEINV